MPLWLIFHPEGTFTTPESKQALAADITTIYTASGLPAFYVIVNFILQPQGTAYVGGQPPREGVDKPFIRFMVDHIAVHSSQDAVRAAGLVKRVDAVLKPHVADKGYGWEYHIDETPRNLWKINGLVPPPFRSQEEKRWFDLNKAVEWEEGAGGNVSK